MFKNHSHYPVSAEERIELYEDLRDFAGLSHINAVETVGFEVSRQVWGCDQTGPLAAFLITSDPSPFTSKRDVSKFLEGAGLGAKVVTAELGVQNV